jgi:hypothetical protein
MKLSAILDSMRDLDVAWEEDPYRRWDKTWTHNLTRLVDAMRYWCHDSGIRSYDIGFTQIELCVTFLDKREAMLFKLRWQGAETA